MLCRALYSLKASPTNSFEAWDQDRDQVRMTKHQKTYNLKPHIYFRTVNKNEQKANTKDQDEMLVKSNKIKNRIQEDTTE